MKNLAFSIKNTKGLPARLIFQIEDFTGLMRIVFLTDSVIGLTTILD